MIQAIRLAGKIMRYARGGYSDDEKQDLVADLLELAALLATDIGGDLAGD
tara:strand:+ start:2326 stop:2475 length:150 start_codon:yes stop_codon:yes gene_type:complete